MILVDANLLIYAVNADAPQGRKAKTWLESALPGGETVAFPWSVLLAFLRLTTRPGLFRNPLRVAVAFEIVAAWLEQPCAVIVHPGPRHLQVLREMIIPLGTGGNLMSDAHLAAPAIEHGAVLCSTDSDFARFPGLNWRNLLV
jgi:toxin-antitoxin system PIN domain toxin